MTIIDKFEQTVKKYPEKIAFIENEGKISFLDLQVDAKKLGTYLINNNIKINDIVAIFTKKSIKTIISILGIMYAGSTYVVLDPDSPYERIEKILSVVTPKIIIFDDSLKEEMKKEIRANFKTILIDINEMLNEEINEAIINNVKRQIISANPAYILFTSGSTGLPKGTVVTHNNVLAYIEWVSTEFKFNKNTIFGSQTPFYFSMSVTDVFSTLFTGATLYIIPKAYFSFPIQLIKGLNENKVNTIYWVPSAYAIIANLKVLDYVKIENLKLAMFAGEVMMSKILNYWMDHLPKVKYANLFGPTETTDICTYYVVKKKIPLTESVPIGYACKNLDVMLINDNKLVTTPNEIGELYCRGAFVASGYYNNEEKTKQTFVQNPLNKHFPEIVYRTGDLCKYNEKHELIYISRKDFQIKHHGYRIELGEIEVAINAMEKIKNAFCLYDEINDQIVLIYEGKLTSEEILSFIKTKLPSYMHPNRFENVKQMKYNQNGKIDRKFYKETLIKETK